MFDMFYNQQQCLTVEKERRRNVQIPGNIVDEDIASGYKSIQYSHANEFLKGNEYFIQETIKNFIKTLLFRKRYLDRKKKLEQEHSTSSQHY